MLMPEGPEVKIMMTNIKQLALGKQLTSVKVIKDDFLKKTKGLEKLPSVLPLNVVDVDTKGKFGYMMLSDGSAIALTFGMTGNIRINPTDEYLTFRGKGETAEQYMKHCKVEFVVQDQEDGETKFYFHCMRNFAWIYYYTGAELQKKLQTIGPSILSSVSLTQVELVQRWRKFNHKTVCEALMEQKLISGIGNYIKAEIMYRSKIYPMVKVKDLSDDHLWTLYQEARLIAADAFHDGGASLYSYTGLHGDQTEFKLKLYVYNRNKDPYGNQVLRINTPDKRTTHWVKEVQTIGTSNPTVPKVKIRAKLKQFKTDQGGQ